MSDETIPQMREQIESLQKKLKDSEKNSAELTKHNRVLQARDVLRDEGFSPAVGELLVAANPEGEITPETVKAFVEQYGVGKIESEANPGGEGEATESEGSGSGVAPGSPDLANLSRGGSRAGEGGAGGATDEPMTKEAWQNLYRTDKAAAQAAVRQGRVQISTDNFYAAQKGVPGENPFAVATQK